MSTLVSPDARSETVDKRGVTLLMKQAQGNGPDVIKALVAAGANATLKDKAGKTAYDYARLGNNARVVPFLRAGTRP